MQMAAVAVLAALAGAVGCTVRFLLGCGSGSSSSTACCCLLLSLNS